MPDHLTDATVEAEYARLSKEELLELQRVFLGNFETWQVSRHRLRIIERILEERACTKGETP